MRYCDKVVAIAKNIDGIAHVGDDGSESVAIHQHAELRRRLPHPEAFQRTPPQREGNRRRDPGKDRRHRGRHGLHSDATADLGLGTGAGYSLFVEDRAGLGYGALQDAVSGAAGRGHAGRQAWVSRFRGYQANVPQLDVDVDRIKAKAQGIALTELFDTLQVYLGSAYVNDFNLFGRTWRVYRAGRRRLPQDRSRTSPI